MRSALALVAEFDTPERLVAAAHALRERGYRELDAFTPYPILELERALGLGRSKVNWVVLPAAIIGAGFAYWLQWFCNAVDYPLNVGGRPLHSAATMIPITFETTVLFGSLAALITLLVRTRLPRLWHPVFEVAGFERASIDRFFLAVGSGDSLFNRVETRGDLERLGASFVAETGGEDR